MFKPEGIILQEVFSKDYYETMFPVYGNRLWSMFRYHTLLTIHMLRETYGTVILNTWHSKKMTEKYGWWDEKTQSMQPHQWRGYRECSCPLIGVSDLKPHGNISQHRFACALDPVFLHVPSEQIRKEVRENPWRREFEFITAIEEKVSWLHFDMRNWDKKEDGIFYFGA